MIGARPNIPPSPFSGMMEASAAIKDEWEVRPGGMLVQKRTPDSESAVAAVAAVIPTIRVKVKYESVYYEIYLSSQSTFGELKKLVAERTGVHPDEQKIVYKEREREGNVYLDVCGVKDKSKMVMVVDPAARARRVLEMRRAAKVEKAAKIVKDVAAQVDAMALKVAGMETLINKGKKVVDKDILNLIEQLMTQLVKLDGVAVDGGGGGDLKLQRGTQVKRVQKYVETLDVLKIKNAKITTSAVPVPSSSSSSSSTATSTTTSSSSQKKQHQQHQQVKKQQAPASLVVTKEWEMFDSLFGPSTSSSTASNTIAPRSDWELF